MSKTTRNGVIAAAKAKKAEATEMPDFLPRLSYLAWITRQYEQWTEDQPMPDWECPERLIVTHDDLEARAQEEFGLGAECRISQVQNRDDAIAQVTIASRIDGPAPWELLGTWVLKEIVADILEEKSRKVEPDLRKDSRIVPSSRKLWASATITGVSTSTKATDRALAVLAGDGVGSVDVPVQADLFPSTEYRVAMLDLVDSAGVPLSAQGGGAPIVMRLMHMAMMATPVESRQQDIRVTLTVRDIVNAIYGGKWTRAHQLPALIEGLSSMGNYAIRVKGGWWSPVLCRQRPDQSASLDDKIVLSLGFPPDMGPGSPIDPVALAQMGKTSVLIYRAYLAVADLAWQPGITRIGAPGMKGWSGDREAYPVLTKGDRDKLAKGHSRSKKHTRAKVDAAFRELPGFVTLEEEIDRKTGKAGWRVIPAEAFKKM